jgi:outer membrane protein
MSIKCIFAICLLLTGPLAASQDLNHPLTLAELVDIALKNHPSTQLTWWNANRAASAVGSAKSAYYPKVGLEANATHGRDFKFINGPDVNYTIVGADLVLSMLLYDFGGRSAGVNGAKMALLAANWQTDWTIQKVMVKVLENAYSTLHAQEVFQATLSSLADAENVFKTAKELNRTGLTPVSDVYTSQAALSQMKMELSQQKALLDIQKGKLAACLGLRTTTPLELAELDTIQAVQKLPIDELIALALNQRADLLSKQAGLSESIYNKDKAAAAHGPKIHFTGRGGADHAFHDKANAAHYQVSLNVDLPLFMGFETMYNNCMAYAETQMAEEELAELQLNISLEVLACSRSLEAAEEMLPEAEENLTCSTKAYESVLDRYKAGKETIASMSNAQRQLAAARIRYSDVKTRWLASIANLAYATGTLAPYMESP